MSDFDGTCEFLKKKCQIWVVIWSEIEIGGVDFRTWVEIWNEIEIGGVSISGFGLKFKVKLKSGGVDFRIWVEIRSETEIRGCRFQDLD